MKIILHLRAENHPYTDAGATAYDISYGSQIVSPSGTVTIGTIGDYPLTYTAPDDLAGNTGPTITRIVLIRDLPPLSLVDDPHLLELWALPLLLTNLFM